MRVQPQENQHTILDAIPTKIKGEISIIQHNTGKREEIQQSLLEIAAKRKGDIIALQEPHAWKNKTTNKYSTITHSMYEVILPSNPYIRPRVALYIRKATLFQFKIRLDLGENTDFLAVEFYSPTERFLLFNLYNEKELRHDSKTQRSGRSTIQRSILNLNPDLPFILLGDFNRHHIWWNSQATKKTHKKETENLVSWLQSHDCQLLNE